MKPVTKIMIIFYLFAISCNNKNSLHLINGKWEYDIKKGFVISIKDGYYNLTRWDDDLVYNSKGCYFLNRNQERHCMTLTLVPNLQYHERDTILLPCENIDIVSITDSILIIQKPTLWINEVKGRTIRKNVTEIYKKNGR